METIITIVGSLLTLLVGAQIWITKTVVTKMTAQADVRDRQISQLIKSLKTAIIQTQEATSMLKATVATFQEFERSEDIVHEKIVLGMQNQLAVIDKIATSNEVLSQKMDKILLQLQRDLDNLKHDYLNKK